MPTTRLLALPLYDGSEPYFFGLERNVWEWEIKTNYGDVAKVNVTAGATTLDELSRLSRAHLYDPLPPRESVPAPVAATPPEPKPDMLNDAGFSAPAVEPIAEPEPVAAGDPLPRRGRPPGRS